MMRSASTADGRVIEAIYGTDWYACRTCEPLVAGRRWRDLLDRAENGQLRRMGYRGRRLSIARAEVAALWLALERHLTGERVRVAGTPEGRR